MTLEKLIEDEESFVPYAYKDSKGYWTIGIGTLIDKDKGGRISRAAALFMLREEIEKIERGLDEKLPWWRTLNEARRQVLVTMAYQMGLDGLLKFKNTLAAVQAGAYEAAARGMLNSKWAREDSPARARRAAYAMREGRWERDAQ